MGDVSGSIRKVTLDGISFDVAADANFKEAGSQYENDVILTSGRNIKKQTKRAKTVEGVTIIANGSEKELLTEMAERKKDIPMSYETAGGDVYRATGWIDFESRETEELKATVKMTPRNNKWEAFVAR